MVYRVFVEKKPGLSPESAALLSDCRDFLGIRALEKVCGGASRVSCIAYGRVPVMTAARCVLKGKNRECRGCGGRRHGLRRPVDRAH